MHGHAIRFAPLVIVHVIDIDNMSVLETESDTGAVSQVKPISTFYEGCGAQCPAGTVMQAVPCADRRAHAWAAVSGVSAASRAR